MQKIKEAKVLQVLKLKERGLGSAEILRVLNYGRSTIKAAYSGNYEMIPFVSLEGYIFLDEKKVMTPCGPATRISKQGYELQNYDGCVKSAESIYISQEKDEHLHGVLNTLPVRDKDIIQAKADEQSNRQIIAEFSTSTGHIKKIQDNLKKALTKESSSIILKDRKEKKIMKMAQEIYNETLAHRGTTMDLAGNVPTSGYMVSELGGVQVPINKFSVQDIEHIIAENRQVLFGTGTYIGTRIDKDTVYADCSVNFTDLGKAVTFGRKNGQKAIYSLNTKETIYL